MAEPPLLAGAVNEIVAWPLPGVAATLVGALGTVGAAATCCCRMPETPEL